MLKSNEEILLAIGTRIQEKRRALQLSQNQLAFESGLRRETINKIESGQINISIIKLLKIIQVLNCPVSEILPDNLTLLDTQ